MTITILYFIMPYVTYLYAALERVCKRHIEKRDLDIGTVITMTISGFQASLGLTTILRWTSSLTPTPGPGYGATPPPQTPPSLQILLQTHLLLYIPKKLLLLAKNFLDNFEYFRSRDRRSRRCQGSCYSRPHIFLLWSQRQIIRSFL